MKREGGNSGSSPMKRSRMDTDGNEAELRLLIQSKAAGSVIGKGGHNISKLRAEFQATITVPDCAGPERVLTICHVEQDAVLKVLESLLPNIDDGGSSRGNGGEDCELRMLVHHSQAGCIIGKAGFKIKELREQTGAQIKVFSTCCPNSTDRIVQVVGKSSTVLECVKQIMDLLKASPIKGVNDPYDPHNYDDYYAHEYGGYGDSSGPNRGMRTPSRSGGRGQVFGSMMGSRSRGPMGPHHMSRNYTDGPRGSGMSPPRGRGPAPLMPRPVSSNGMGSRGFMSFDSPPLEVGFAEDSQPQETTQVSIPKELAGSIIGKGGARIRKIRSDSGAGITIDEPLPGSNDRIITITGTSSQIQMAQFLLQQSVRENSGRKF